MPHALVATHLTPLREPPVGTSTAVGTGGCGKVFRRPHGRFFRLAKKRADRERPRHPPGVTGPSVFHAAAPAGVSRDPVEALWSRRPPRAYLLRLTSSCSISSLVVITRAFDWKPLCVVIMFVNSCARSTFDISSAPEVMND